MQLAADLHIHSCLSPCGDAAMTPNNLVNMAYIKGLDVIALSDHNSAWNLPAAAAVAKERKILLIPAIEVETREEVHVLCYLRDIPSALEFGERIYSSLPDIPNMPDFYGEQLVLNEDDDILRSIPKLLIQATALSLDEVAALARSFGGVPVPAHINRSSNSLIANLGFIPDAPAFTAVEVYRRLPLPGGVSTDRFHVLHSSDAHDLESILERESFLNIEDRTVEAVLKYLAAPK